MVTKEQVQCLEYPGYRDIVGLFSDEILVEVETNDYQGDSIMLLKLGTKFGILKFGWGSCSFCDALQACDDDQERADLANELFDQTVWFDSLSEVESYLVNKDWELEYCVDLGLEFNKQFFNFMNNIK